MLKKDIKLEYKQKKNLAKQAYKNERSKLRAVRTEQMQVYHAQTDKTDVVNPPKRPILEEVGNAVSHGVGSIFAIVAYILMIIRAQTSIQFVAATIYFFGLFTMFTMSCLYHAFRHGSTVKRVFRRFDYSSIYLLIGATFAPLLLCFVGGTFGLVFLIAQWSIIATGITFVAVFGPTKFKGLHMTLYIVLGWSGLVFLPLMLKISLPLFFYILGGGVVYSLGIIPFAVKKKASHFIWHFFVLAGAIFQWLGIYLYLYV